MFKVEKDSETAILNSILNASTQLQYNYSYKLKYKKD